MAHMTQEIKVRVTGIGGGRIRQRILGIIARLLGITLHLTLEP